MAKAEKEMKTEKSKKRAKITKTKKKDKGEEVVHPSEEIELDDGLATEGKKERESSYANKKVVVSGLPYTTTEQDIRDFFDKVGLITKMRMTLFPDTGNFKGLAFLTFKTMESATRSLELDGTKMGDRYIKVERCRQDPQKKEKSEFLGEPEKIEGCLSVYIGNLAKNVTEDSIRNFFDKSKITSIRLATNKKTNKFRGFGHIDFKNNKSLEEAMKKNQMEFNGKPIKISICFCNDYQSTQLNSTPLNSTQNMNCHCYGYLLTDLSKPIDCVDSKEFNEQKLVVCFGEMLIDFVPTVTGVSLAEAPAFQKAPGGAPANVAVGISRLGGSSAFIGKVGEDEFGYMLADILKVNNVDNSGMRFDHKARTALSFITLRADGEREFLFFRNPSADMLLHEFELDLELIKKASIFHYGSISLIENPCRSTHLTALKFAKSFGCLLSYDPNLRLALWPSSDAAKENIMSIWDQSDIIKVSEDEISFLTGGDDPNDDDVVMKKLFHPNLKLLIVTEGKAGCRYYTKNFFGRVDGIKVKPIDTTGAGDAFVSGILSNLASDLSLFEDEKKLREALVFANACGAIVVQKRGAIPALPTKEAVLELVQHLP